jgi:hypothetical protein
VDIDPTEDSQSKSVEHDLLNHFSDDDEVLRAVRQLSYHSSWIKGAASGCGFKVPEGLARGLEEEEKLMSLTLKRAAPLSFGVPMLEGARVVLAVPKLVGYVTATPRGQGVWLEYNVPGFPFPEPFLSRVPFMSPIDVHDGRGMTPLLLTHVFGYHFGEIRRTASDVISGTLGDVDLAVFRRLWMGASDASLRVLTNKPHETSFEAIANVDNVESLKKAFPSTALARGGITECFNPYGVAARRLCPPISDDEALTGPVTSLVPSLEFETACGLLAFHSLVWSMSPSLVKPIFALVAS